MLNALELRAIAYVVAAGLFTWLGAHLAGLHYEAIIAKDRAAVEQAAAQAAVAAKAQQDVANANNNVVVARLQAKLDTTIADNTDLANQLSDARARRSNLPKAPNIPGAPATGEPSSSRQLDELIAAALTECQQNSARQDALIQELKPQL
jgi:hypothetical protein